MTYLSRLSPSFRIFTHLTVRERQLLYARASDLPAGAVALEIGSYLGASASFLAEGIRAGGGTVYAVDTWANQDMSEGPRDTYADFLKNVARLRQHIVPLRGRSEEIAKTFDDRIDLLFVDGDHSFEAARSDLEAWLPKVRNGGIVILHDYNWADGVRRAVREVLVPRQTGGGHRLDSMYWAGVGPLRLTDLNLTASIIVPTSGRDAWLADTLAALLNQTLAGNYEILVVDNAPTPSVEATVRRAAATSPLQVRYLHEPHGGLVYARHRGAREARSELLVYVDDDVIAFPDWLRAILEPMNDPRVGIAGGRVFPEWEKDPPEWVHEFPPSYLSLLDLGDDKKQLTCPGGVYGCNMVVRRSALFECGGFNPDAVTTSGFPWKRGDGETGLHRKVLEAGYTAFHVPDARVYHRIPETRLTLSSFYRRALTSGLSLSYSDLRNSVGSRLFMLRLLVRTGGAIARIKVNLVRALVPRPKRVRYVSLMWFWWGYLLQHLRSLVDSDLRAYILEDTYF